MIPGDVIRMTHYEHRQGDVRMGFSAPKGKVVLAVLIGHEPKDGSAPLEVGKALRALGWIPGPELAEARPDL